MTVLRERISVEGSAIYCNPCNRRGAAVAYDPDGFETTREAEGDGWDCDAERDVCPDCVCKLKDGSPIR